MTKAILYECLFSNLLFMNCENGLTHEYKETKNNTNMLLHSYIYVQQKLFHLSSDLYKHSSKHISN